jgi:hypothetical protein
MNIAVKNFIGAILVCIYSQASPTASTFAQSPMFRSRLAACLRDCRWKAGISSRSWRCGPLVLHRDREKSAEIAVGRSDCLRRFPIDSFGRSMCELRVVAPSCGPSVKDKS